MTARTVFVVNSGSSSIKYQLVDPDAKATVAAGIVERIGREQGQITHKSNGEQFTRSVSVPNHSVGLDLVLEMFAAHGPKLTHANVVAVGHRVVQGADRYSGPVLVTAQVEEEIRHFSTLAPLHNPANLQGIAGARHVFPDLPHVAVFDTAFFANLPAAASTYALPRDLAAKHGIKRYGAHGTSHNYVSQAAAEFLGADRDHFAVIVLHLGNGASVSAVRNGEAIETSMGFTPLEGLVMGTRCGDLDPAILVHLARVANMSFAEIDTLLNKQSGVFGLTGVTDMRDLHEKIAAGDQDAATGLAVYLHRIKGYVGNYMAHLGHVDAIVFTAGIGENDDVVRAGALAGLEEFGIQIDPVRNAGRCTQPRVISTAHSRVTVAVVPTNEELAIAQQTIAALKL